jgi:hypothetical protein
MSTLVRILCAKAIKQQKQGTIPMTTGCGITQALQITFQLFRRIDIVSERFVMQIKVAGNSRRTTSGHETDPPYTTTMES